ncbi:hypothetical protein CONPUDRAFT_146476 [Coniophora puteana RWD-64-598 SS2]|uniref:DUF6534 domain-containing protein n=1 Tax=Coniophora puteana (strain RWD-64-598) TaxID=741705 RepID=A0A5M3MBP5_CONPW|nr:uncharacterized protein CONPUDRAFT_146476 [Coniophora puteana RWD-64-598 SS2]EIW76659.1 hypothetical protein CONPUDRAFT_146476 [Coniophora puteana RWD-64-598 SS2]
MEGFTHGSLAQKLTEGPLVGAFLSMMLYGAACLQVWHYFFNYRKDPLWIKAMVSFIWVLETFNSGLLISLLLDCLVLGRSDKVALDQISWQSALLFLLGFVLGFTSTLVYTLSLVAIINGSLKGLVSQELVYGFSTRLNIFRLGKDWLSYGRNAHTALSLGLTLVLSGDFACSCIIVFYLWHTFTHGEHEGCRTDRLINHLVGYTVITGLLNTMLESAALASYLMSPHTFVFAGILIVQTRLYAQSTLTSLNMRSSNRQLLNTSPVACIMERSSLIGKRPGCEELRRPIYYRQRTNGFDGRSDVQEHYVPGMSQSQTDENIDYY